MFSDTRVPELLDPDALQAWQAFSLAFWDEPCFGLDQERQRQLFQAGFFRSRWFLYGMVDEPEPGYLSDFQAMRLQAANAKYQTVMADRVLCSHVMSNYCKVPEIHCVVTSEEVQWITSPWWRQGDAGSGELIIHPTQFGMGSGYQRVLLEDGSFRGPMGEGRSDELVQTLQARARQESCSYVLTEHVAQGGFAESLAPGHLNLLNVLLVREQNQWQPELAATTLLIGREREDGSHAMRVEDGALSASVDLETGLITSCKGLDESSQALASFPIHPQLGSSIVGRQLPDWQKTRQMLIAFFDESSYLRACNLTFLLTDDGPCFFAVCEGQLATHQIHRPLLSDPFISSHIDRLGA
ncbi:sugar-transfer associated ATP-grasp domain-containing protein [Halomonas sp. 328]|uniref:sugar-transfer associated ATP-grasp domain-containing protein n=1 Tax=Halomonas sp. 328 TaxID=2776704 RepID=UPI0018A727BF|nr:sugar-transfer associated ATP-grasp domain-containing protein [Halomonas sp. 328]MBF8223905.1 hypothetical protein [Halomonas sp. 328]